jgi:hypothetical protein
MFENAGNNVSNFVWHNISLLGFAIQNDYILSYRA